MRGFGILLIVVAALLLITGLAMDTSVATGEGTRVHNIGLMRAQENAILIAVALFIGGVVLVAMGGKKRSEARDDSEVKACPYCAETIMRQAIVCRFCGRDLPGTVKDKSAPAPVPEGPKNVDTRSGISLGKPASGPEGPGNGKSRSGIALLLIGAFLVFSLLALHVAFSNRSTSNRSTAGLEEAFAACGTGNNNPETVKVAACMKAHGFLWNGYAWVAAP